MNFKRTKRARVVFWSIESFFCIFLFFISFHSNAFAKEMGQENSFLIDKSYDFYNRSDVDAFLVKESENAYFYFEKEYYNNFTDEQKANIQNQIGTLAKEFDETVYPSTRKVFGEEWNPGIDDNGKVVILFTRLQDNIGGYFNPNDEYLKDQVTDSRSNEDEMIYLNPDFLQSGKIEGFLAHELQHMIYWNEKTRLKGTIDEVWINEGRSELASSIIEDDLGKNAKNETLAVRKKDFLSDYTDSLVDWSNSNADYSSVNIFMQYMNDHFSADIFKDMNSTGKTGVNNLNYILKVDEGIDLNTVFTDWTVANYVNNTKLNPKYGYFNKHLRTGFNVSPTLASDKNNNGVINLTDRLKNWSGNYYKVDLSKQQEGLYVEMDFNGDDAGEFAVPFVINYKDGTQEIDAISLNSEEDGVRSRIFKAGTVSSVVFIASSQKMGDGITNNQVKSYDFSLDVKVSPTKDKVLPDGTLIKSIDSEKVYLVESGQKRWIVDAAAFAYYGYDWGKITAIDTTEMGLYPDGSDIKIKITSVPEGSLVKGDGPQVYLIENGKKRWIQDEQTFVSYGFEWGKIIKLSEYEILKYEDGEALIKSPFTNGALIKSSDPKIYLIENGKKRWIVSPEAFRRNNFSWSSVVETSRGIIASYQDGSNVE